MLEDIHYLEIKEEILLDEIKSITDYIKAIQKEKRSRLNYLRKKLKAVRLEKEVLIDSLNIS